MTQLKKNIERKMPVSILVYTIDDVMGGGGEIRYKRGEKGRHQKTSELSRGKNGREAVRMEEESARHRALEIHWGRGPK